MYIGKVIYIMGKKLIEVALPLDAINKASAREKSIRHGHPSTLHLWWARRPLATARATIFASLVDDPSAHPDVFPTVEVQEKERKRLFRLIERLVSWENSANQELLAEAYQEILKSTNDTPPALLDPFAGGGAIPLEAQRLGLKAYAGDLNPVAVMINKAMIEIPPRFKNKQPVSMDRSSGEICDDNWQGADGLAEDIKYYGNLLKEKAYAKIGYLYPKVKLPDSDKEATVIAWLWTRTVKCPNPACGCKMPLVRSFVLSKKKGKETYVVPIITGKTIRYEVHKGKNAPEGTVNRSGAKCICCGAAVPFDYIRNESRNGRMSSQLMAIVAEGNPGRIYINATDEHTHIADIPKPAEYPDAEIAHNLRDFHTLNYGMKCFSNLFTNRQLMMLTTFCDLLDDVQQKVYHDAIQAGFSDDAIDLAQGGIGATAYSEAIRVYLSFLIDKLADRNSNVCGWDVSRDGIRNTFARQAILIVWDYAEANPFSHSSGCVDNMLEWITKCITNISANMEEIAVQQDAEEDNGLRNVMVSTDPPYYDNIAYADLSDFFYIWLRKNLQSIYPNVFSTVLVPKREELVAIPYRFDGNKEKAKKFFETGMYKACRQIYQYTREDIPVTIYYAFKQSDTDDKGTASSGWETMLSAIIRAGFTITGTWPMRTEMTARSVAQGSNALASSIVLVCRKRNTTDNVCTRKQFLRILQQELQEALRELKEANIAPVDLAQVSIGPGIGVYSRYEKVLEADGSAMSVRDALRLINHEIDEYFEGENASLDAASRFCITLYSQNGFNEINFGDADELARAKNTAVSTMQRQGIVIAGKGKVRLAERTELSAFGDDIHPSQWLETQQLVYLMETKGIQGCAEALKNHIGNFEIVKNLAYRLYTVADRKGLSKEGSAYNNLVVAWPDIVELAGQLQHTDYKDESLF